MPLRRRLPGRGKDGSLVDLMIDGPPDANTTVALAHGAGVGFDTPFMNTVAAGLAERGIRVARFEFDYMARSRRDGKRRPPDRLDRLIACWRQVVAELGAGRLVVAGRSMGGRIASMIADDIGASGLVCLGYPFHPVGKPDQLRIDHLGAIQTPTLILQGERDALGAKAEVDEYPLATSIRIVWLTDGDHGFRPRISSGRTESENLEDAIAAMATFVLGLSVR